MGLFKKAKEARAAGPGPGEREDGSASYGAVFDEVVAQMHIARVQPGARIAVFVDAQNPHDMAIDWIRTGQLGAPAPGSIPGPGEPGAPGLIHRATSSRIRSRSSGLSRIRLCAPSSS
jgi:hypothetical protein